MLNVIIPTLNAEETLAKTLDSIRAGGGNLPHEVLVVDGGSGDATPTIAAARGAKVLSSAPGRGRQLAMGAAAAIAAQATAADPPWLLFVHADSLLPTDWADTVQPFITPERNRERAGYFRLGFDGTPDPRARRVARLANWRADVLGLPYGDQGVLIHATLYMDVGGFRVEQNLMEDVDLVRRIGPMRLTRLSATVTTSAVRYRQGGWWGRPLRNVVCLGLYVLGAPNRWIERLYR